MNALTTRAKIGYWLAVLLAVVDVATLLLPTPADGEGPPVAVTLFSAVMGVITLVAAVLVARTGRRSGLRVMAVSRILSAITALPAFFVEGPPPIIVAAGAAMVVLTIVAVVLLMSRARSAVTSAVR
jgi:hypothetical protein